MKVGDLVKCKTLNDWLAVVQKIHKTHGIVTVVIARNNKSVPLQRYQLEVVNESR